MTDNDALRASHEDRDRIAEVLRIAAGDGRLSAEELDERLESALTAKTYRELAELTADLPAVSGSLPAVPEPGGEVAAPEPKALMRIDVGSGGVTRQGRWVVPKEMDVKIASGGVRLDFTSAAITQPVLRINAEIRSGGLLLITKPGIVIDADDVTVRSGGVSESVPWGHDVPVRMRIVLSGSVRSGGITARPPRRSFWEWLRRAPRRWEIAARQPW
jgi:hypothetical protein